jgi:heptosyltransferase-3
MAAKTNSAPKSFKRILIARGGAIGDFILTLPVFQALKAAFPQATLGCLAPVGRGEIAQMAGLADEIRNVDDRCWASFFVRDGQLDGVACNWLSSFDCIISYLHDPNETWKTNVARVSDAFYLIGCHQPGEISDVPASVTLLKALEPMGIFYADPVPRIIHSGAVLKSGTIALHPGSGSESKNWPEEYWCQLISLLLEQENMKLMIVGGEAETKRVRRLGSKFSIPRLRLLLNEPLTSVARELVGCRIFVGHDSGITHLAAALGVRCVVLWSQTNEKVWRPSGEMVHILKRCNNITPVKPRAVFQIVKKLTSVH